MEGGRRPKRKDVWAGMSLLGARDVTGVLRGDEEALGDAGYRPGRAACASSVDRVCSRQKGSRGTSGCAEPKLLPGRLSVRNSFENISS